MKYLIQLHKGFLNNKLMEDEKLAYNFGFIKNKQEIELYNYGGFGDFCFNRKIISCADKTDSTLLLEIKK